ncbi:MAG: hypothetical protein AB7O24_31250 [Kofleriaceae bacterium]
MRWWWTLSMVAACGGGPSGDSNPDAANSVDADPQAQCLVDSDYGALGAKAGAQSMGPTRLAVELAAIGEPRDVLFINLKDGQGVFAGGLTTGTFTISGDEADFINCGLCVSIIADLIPMVGPTKFYAASSGTVTITATTPPAGSAQDLTFREVMVDGTDAMGDCASSIESISFMQP